MNTPDPLFGSEPPTRFSLTYEEWLDDAVADPEAYGLTKEQATEQRRIHHEGKTK